MEQIACASPDRGREAIMQTKWVLEIYGSGRKTSLISKHEFDDFPSLTTKIMENRDCKYRIEPPDHAASNEFQCLLDLRDKGFKLERK
jgi:hypothetical protein